MVLPLKRGLPGAPGLIATVACENRCELDPGVGQRRGSGPNDFAVRFGSTRPVMPSLPSHPALHVRDDAHAPLVSAGYANINHAFPKNGSEEFLARSFSPWPSLGCCPCSQGRCAIPDRNSMKTRGTGTSKAGRKCPSANSRMHLACADMSPGTPDSVRFAQNWQRSHAVPAKRHHYSLGVGRETA